MEILSKEKLSTHGSHDLEDFLEKVNQKCYAGWSFLAGMSIISSITLHASVPPQKKKKKQYFMYPANLLTFQNSRHRQWIPAVFCDEFQVG